MFIGQKEHKPESTLYGYLVILKIVIIIILTIINTNTNTVHWPNSPSK